MDSSDGLMVEEKSRLSILVIEDNPEFGRNAMEALKGHDVTLVTTLHEALDTTINRKFDFILSDVHFPIKSGRDSEAIVREVLNMGFKSDTPVCFVTKADHHGLVEMGDEGYVSLRAATVGMIASTFIETSRSKEEITEADLFRKMKVSKSENVKADSKTPEIWSRALEMLRNVSANPCSLTRAIKKVRGIGVDVEIKDGMPKVVPSKK